MSSDPLMMDYEGGDLLLAGAACAGCWVTHCPGCVCRLGGDLNSGLVGQFQWRKCTLWVPGAWNALYRSTSLPFFLPFFIFIRVSTAGNLLKFKNPLRNPGNMLEFCKCSWKNILMNQCFHYFIDILPHVCTWSVITFTTGNLLDNLLSCICRLQCARVFDMSIDVIYGLDHEADE